MSKGKINAYTCETCARKTVTIDRDEGVTPFMIDCSYCAGIAQSAFYRVPQNLTPTHEWYKPDEAELNKMKIHSELKQTVEHIERGGLVKHKIGEPTWYELWKAHHPEAIDAPYEARLANDEPGPRLMVTGCKDCGLYRIILSENPRMDGSWVRLFEEGDDAEAALSTAAFWGHIIGIPVEIEESLASEVADGDVLVRGHNGEAYVGPGAGEEPDGLGELGGCGGGDRAPVESRGGSDPKDQDEAQDSVPSDQGRDSEQGDDQADQPGAGLPA